MTPAQFQAIKERLEARIADFKHRVGMALSHNPTYPIMLRPEHLRDLYTNLAACVDAIKQRDAEITRLREALEVIIYASELATESRDERFYCAERARKETG